MEKSKDRKNIPVFQFGHKYQILVLSSFTKPFTVKHFYNLAILH